MANEQLLTYGEAIGRVAAVYGDSRDRLGQLALLHPLQVAEHLDPDDLDGQLAALFHDTVEDDYLRADDLHALALPAQVREAVLAISRRPEESYDTYIDRLATTSGEPGAIARRVKLADLEINLARVHQLNDSAEEQRLQRRWTAAQQQLQAR